MMGNKMVAGLLVGAAAGAAVGMMMAPKTGKETRELLRDRAGKVQNRAELYLGTLRSKIGAKSDSA